MESFHSSYLFNSLIKWFVIDDTDIIEKNPMVHNNFFHMLNSPATEP